MLLHYQFLQAREIWRGSLKYEQCFRGGFNPAFPPVVRLNAWHEVRASSESGSQARSGQAASRFEVGRGHQCELATRGLFHLISKAVMRASDQGISRSGCLAEGGVRLGLGGIAFCCPEPAN